MTSNYPFYACELKIIWEQDELLTNSSNMPISDQMRMSFFAIPALSAMNFPRAYRATQATCTIYTGHHKTYS
jgi:hypothetical protein